MFLKFSFKNIIVTIGRAVVIFHSYKPTGTQILFIELAATLGGKKEI